MQTTTTTIQRSASVATGEPGQKTFEKKKTIFRFYQVIWYFASFIEVLLGFRFLLKAFGANPFNIFTSFIYQLSSPFATPFQGIFPSGVSDGFIIEWSTIVGMVVYLVVAYGIVEIAQFIKPVSKEEVEQAIDEQE